MKRKPFIGTIIVAAMSLGVMTVGLCGCNRPSKAEVYKQEKHVKDSVALENQMRSMEYYQAVRDSLLPQADSLMRYFKYEKNEKYQDHGYYIITAKWGNVRIMVRDDGEEALIYENGKRKGEWANGQLDERFLEKAAERDKESYLRAEELYTKIRDINELEKRIAKTSLEIQKYQKRLQKN